jgi:hypothetical protein
MGSTLSLYSSTRSGRELIHLIERLELPELCLEERLGIAGRLREALGTVHEHALREGQMQ